jgi:hypothetical protein
MAIQRKNRSNTPATSPSHVPTPAPTTLRSNINSIYRNSNKFNPKLIFSQILALQSLHYIILSILIQTNYLVFGIDVTIDRIFTPKHLSLWTREGRIDAMAIFISSLFG